MIATARGRQFALLSLLLLLTVPLGAADPASLTYRKVFKNSSPEFLEIKVRESGVATCDIRSLEDEPDAQPFEVSQPLAAKLFELAAELHHFRDAQLDVKRRVADLGRKTFRYERAGEAHEVTFNYTLNAGANQLMQIFEGLGRQEEHRRILLRRMRYDRLGVNEALLNFETDLNRRILPEPESLLPTLEQIANDTRFLDISRQRARALAERIRAAR